MTPPAETPHFDTLIIGSGLAGLTLALTLAERGCPGHKIALICKTRLGEGASQWAQGGIAAVLDPADSLETHVQDTLVAGAGLCDEAATRTIVAGGSDAIAWLARLGTPFTPDTTQASGWHLTREGGHAQRRIVHAADATGAAVMSTLAGQVARHPDIHVFEHCQAIDLIAPPEPGKTGSPTCQGAWVQDAESGTLQTLLAHTTVLATGGAGQIYRHTTNPETATGDGIGMAWRAGCRLSNLEFIQFHPTSLFHPQGRSFLISEALRGEGALLRLPDGSRFMPHYDPRAELAPRDIVARAIHKEIMTRKLDCVYLDISHQPAAFIREHFPTIEQRCRALGVDICREGIPVVPAAHYSCGGVLTTLTGETDVDGLYALGETACTGLHGANRLASNSLLECVVLAQAAATAILQRTARSSRPTPPPPEFPPPSATHAAADWLPQTVATLRQTMSEQVGIVRSLAGLQAAARTLAEMTQAMQAHWPPPRLTPEWIDTRNLLDVAQGVTQCALQRQESRGLHYNQDFPEKLPEAKASFLRLAP